MLTFCIGLFEKLAETMGGYYLGKSRYSVYIFFQFPAAHYDPFETDDVNLFNLPLAYRHNYVHKFFIEHHIFGKYHHKQQIIIKYFLLKFLKFNLQ